MKADPLHKKENPFKTLFKNAPIPYQTLNADGNIIEVNNNWIETLGYNREEVTGKWFGNYISIEHRDIFKNLFPAYKDEARIDKITLQLICKDGSPLTASFHGEIEYSKPNNINCIHCIFIDITEETEDETSISKSEQRYRRLSEATFESIFISENGICIEQNATAEKMFGYSLDEAVGQPGTNWIAPQDRKIVKNNILAGYEKPYEVTALRKDGSTFPCEIQGRVLAHENKKIRITALRDISNRKKAEENLRDSEQRHRLIFEHSPLSIIRFSNDGQIIDFNDKFVTLMGATREKLIGFNTVKKSSPQMSKAVQRAINGHTSFYEDFYTSITGGVTHYIRAIFNPVDPENTPTEVIATLEDISERKIVEDKLARSEERFRLLAENAKDLIYRFSTLNKNFEYVSPASTSITGYPPEYFYKNSHFIFDIAHPDWRLRMDRQWKKMALGKASPLIEFQIIHKSGEVRWLQQSNVTLYDKGKPIAVEGIVRDVTDLKNALEKVEKEKARAEAASNTKSEFLANMSHEIRTPLNGIMGMLQLMNGNTGSPEHEEYINAAIQASKRLNNVLSDILDLTRVESGKLMIQETDFSPAEIIKQIFELFELTSRQSGLKLKMIMDPEIPVKLKGDGLRLQQILSNIVGNAIKFTESGSVTIKAERLPRSRPGTTRLLFVVQDTGPGISEEEQIHLFDSFTQISKGYTRQHQGVGLGLAICKRLISLMDGSISIESKVGTGTNFYISIPFDNSMSKTIPSEKEPHTSGSLTGYSILVAEDEKVNRLYTKRYLEQMHCTVYTATNGQEALDILNYEEIDAVLMDVQMPVMNGLETTQAIRRGEAGAHNKKIPIIAVTAYAMLDDKENFIAGGMDDYIPKPVEKKELIKALNRVMGKAKQ